MTSTKIHNMIVEVIKLIREEQREEYQKKFERLNELESIIKDVIQYGHLYHNQKQRLKELGFKVEL